MLLLILICFQMSLEDVAFRSNIPVHFDITVAVVYSIFGELNFKNMNQFHPFPPSTVDKELITLMMLSVMRYILILLRLELVTA